MSTMEKLADGRKVRVKWFTARTPYGEVEDYATDAYGGETPIKVVEIFDHPDSVGCFDKDGNRLYTDDGKGVWLVGDPDDVDAVIEHYGYDWHETQAFLTPPELDE
jgi:hypothetical protein